MDYFDTMRQEYGNPSPTIGLILDKPYHWTMQKPYMWLIDAGHGGIDKNGRYTTKPYQTTTGLWETKMHIHGTHHTSPLLGEIREGAINRQIARLVYEALGTDYDCALIYDDVEDTPLAERVRTADAVHAKVRKHNQTAILVSLHSDKLSLAKVPNPTQASDFVPPAGTASGCSVYTSKGQTKSDKIANIFWETGRKLIPHMNWRTDKKDGDYDMEADFYILRKTDCPAILCETGFYDNAHDAAWLTSPAGQQQYASYIIQAIKACEKLKPI